MSDLRSNRTFNNYTGGVLAPLVYGRFDLPVYQKGLQVCDNNIVIPQGGFKFRTGTVYVKPTRLNKKAVFIPFQFSDQQSYLIELTAGYMRFYKDNGVILEGAKTITNITSASPGVITSNGHGYENGDEVFISGVVGMTELNNKYYLIANKATNTFQLTDIAGNAIDTSGFTAYSSGGEVSRVYEIEAPWDEDHLEYVQYAQSADTMYLTNQNYEPRKLTRAGHVDWTLATYTRTSDPFTPSTAVISGITKANPGVVTATAHGFEDGDIVHIDGVVGMTQVNSKIFVVTNKGTNDFELYDLFGEKVDTSGYSNYTSDGVATKADEWPRSVAFTGAGRLVFASTRANPETVWASKAPANGDTEYENHTVGTGATDALIFTLSPEFNGKVDVIMWLANTSKFLVAGCYGTIRRIYGATEADGITPTGFNAKSINSYGCAATIPVSNGANLFYIQRASKRIRSLEYDYQTEGYTTIDRNLVSDHISREGMLKIIEQQGQPDLIWGVRSDGALLGLTFKDREDISGWHRHFIAGSHVNDSSVTKSWGRVLHIGNMPRPTQDDQIWLIVERVINGSTVRSVEYFADYPEYPVRSDFYQGSESEDNENYTNILFETQKDAIHMDMSLSYDGSDYGVDANATLTPGAVTGEDITFTASAAVFTSDMVGRQLWKKYDSNGDGGGRAEITEYTDSTHVVCKIKSDFDSTDAIAAGDWFLTTGSVSGLEHLEGETVKIVADGGPVADDVVEDGVVSLSSSGSTVQASKVHVGLGYVGFVGLLNIDSGGQNGTAQARRRNIFEAAITYQNALGIEIGTDPYNLERVVFTSTAQKLGRPAPPFSGTRMETVKDSWLDSNQKHFYFRQASPLPSTILTTDLFMVTNDE